MENLPLIRRVCPQLLAEQITSVQPMTGTEALLFRLQYKVSWRYRLECFWYRISRCWFGKHSFSCCTGFQFGPRKCFYCSAFNPVDIGVGGGMAIGF